MKKNSIFNLPAIMLFLYLLILFTGIAVYFPIPYPFIFSSMGIFFILWVYTLFRRERLSLRLNRLHFLIFLFFMWIFFSMLVNGNQNYTFIGLKDYFIGLSIVILVSMVVDDISKYRHFLLIILIVGSLKAIVGIYNYYFGSEIALYYTGQSYEVYSRATIEGQNTNFFAMALLIPLFICIGHFVLDSKKWMPLWISSMTIISFALLMSFSRGGYLAFCIGLIALTVILRKKILIFIIVGIACVFVLYYSLNPAFTQRTQTLGDVKSISTVQQRIELSKYGLEVWFDNVLFGVGTGNISKLGKRKNLFFQERAVELHNTYVQLLAETGIIGFCLFLIIIFYSIRYIWLNRLKIPINYYVLASFISVMVASLALTASFRKEFWLLFAIGIVNKKLLQQKL